MYILIIKHISAHKWCLCKTAKMFVSLLHSSHRSASISIPQAHATINGTIKTQQKGALILLANNHHYTDKHRLNATCSYCIVLYMYISIRHLIVRGSLLDGQLVSCIHNAHKIETVVYSVKDKYVS